MPIMSLDELTAKWAIIVEKHLSSYMKQPITLWLTDADKIRLLNLRVWRDRHKVSLQFILEAILPFWLNRKFRVPVSGRLGIRVSSLVGQKSYSILLDAIRKAYPSDENLYSWQAEQAQLILEMPLWEATDYSTVSSAYKKHLRSVVSKRKKVSKILQRRRYRGNPFIV